MPALFMSAWPLIHSDVLTVSLSFCTLLLLRSREPPPLYRGLVFCFLLLGSSATQTAVLHQYFHRQFRLGMRVRAAVSALIYRKALKIQAGSPPPSWEAPPASGGSSSTGGRTTGQYVNLLAVDAQRLQDLMTYVHILWSAPLQICIALVLLFRLLRLAALGGLAVMMLNGPLTGESKPLIGPSFVLSVSSLLCPSFSLTDSNGLLLIIESLCLLRLCACQASSDAKQRACSAV